MYCCRFPAAVLSTVLLPGLCNFRCCLTLDHGLLPGPCMYCCCCCWALVDVSILLQGRCSYCCWVPALPTSHLTANAASCQWPLQVGTAYTQHIAPAELICCRGHPIVSFKFTLIRRADGKACLPPLSPPPPKAKCYPKAHSPPSLTFVLPGLIQLQACLDDIDGLQAAGLDGATHGAWQQQWGQAGQLSRRAAAAGFGAPTA